MRRLLSVLLLLLAASLASAQTISLPPAFINFQGRLSKPDGTPVPDTNSQSLVLSLWDSPTVGQGTMRWQQTFNNVTVHNGVFAVLLDFSTGSLNFIAGNTLDTALNNNAYLQIQVGTSAPLSPRQLLVSTPYALKAGSVPDGSITAAKLATSARILTGAAGGDLTGNYPTPQILTNARLLNQVTGGLMQVANAQAVTAQVDQQQLTQTSIVTSQAWQSFTPSITGTLVEVDVYCGTSGGQINATLNIYDGTGTVGTLLKSTPITINPTLGLQQFPLSLSVTSGHVYTWSIGSNNSLLFAYAGGTPYAGGHADLGLPFSYAFQTLMKANAGPVPPQVNMLSNLYMQNTFSILEDPTTAPMLTKQLNLFTGGAYAGVGRFGLFQEPNTLFLGIPGSDVAGSSLRIGSWSPTQTRTDALTVLNTGLVGIGTTTPDQALTVGGNLHIAGTGNGLVFPDGTKQTTAPVFQGAAAGGDLTGAYPNPTLATLPTSLAKVSGGAMTALPSGYIGIGTGSPSDILTVAGAGTAISAVDGAVKTRLFSSAASGYGFVGTSTNNGLALRTNDTNRVIITPAGNVGIGTANPQNNALQIHDVFDPSNGYGLTVSNHNYGANIQYDGSGIGLFISKHDAGTNSLALLVSSNVGSSAGNVFAVYDSGSVSNSGNLYTGSILAGGYYADANNHRMVSTGVDGQGFGALYLNQDANWNHTHLLGEIYVDGINGFAGDIFAGGDVYARGVKLSSDARYKTHIATFNNALDTVLNLRGVTFDWNRDAWKERNYPEGRQIGFIAQEVERVLPELVDTDRKGYKSVAYANVVPVLVEAIKDLKAQLDAKEKRVVALEEQVREIEALKAQLKRQQVLEAQIAALAARLSQIETGSPK